MSPADGAAAERLARARESVAGLYGMVDLSPDEPGARARAERLAGALLDGGARVLQLRMKGAAAQAMLEMAGPLRAITRARQALFVVNDRLDVALAAEADGVHLGQEDLPVAEARARVPAHFLVGISTHDEAQARAAAAGGADYLGFGPVFPTRTKAEPDPVVGTERLAEVCRAVALPVCAIGGIDHDNIRAVVAAGAAAAAVISAVNFAPDMRAAARKITVAFSRR